DTLIEGFSHFVTSMTAPIASGWSGCRVGLAPTGKRRLCTAHAKYRDRGLVVVGVHTPEFPFERSASNVQAALKRHGITYPVAQDNDSQTWNAFGNQHWPAQHIVDQSGKIVFQHDGEGQYEQIDRTIARLLNASS